jgi:methylated-DNA-protein-cysteine methyltransferase-like protein
MSGLVRGIRWFVEEIKGLKEMDKFSLQVVSIIGRIPVGMVATYGDIAITAGSSTGARQVGRLLNSCSKKYKLPWHRVVNREGKISARKYGTDMDQRLLLENEGVEFSSSGKIDFSLYLWIPEI